MSSTEEKIIQSAIKEFSEHGFAGARMDRIAKNAKVNKAMIYYHYKNKEKLYESLVDFHATNIYNILKNIADESEAGIGQLYSVISKFIEYFDSLGPDIVRILMWEIVSGGKYIRKIVFPKIIQPLSSLLAGNIIQQIESKTIRSVNPYYTLMQIFGGIIYFNIVKLALTGTEIHEKLFTGDYIKNFSKNLVSVLKQGIELK